MTAGATEEAPPDDTSTSGSLGVGYRAWAKAASRTRSIEAEHSRSVNRWPCGNGWLMSQKGRRAPSRWRIPAGQTTPPVIAWWVVEEGAAGPLQDVRPSKVLSLRIQCLCDGSRNAERGRTETRWTVRYRTHKGLTSGPDLRSLGTRRRVVETRQMDLQRQAEASYRCMGLASKRNGAC